jgi:hypothetical protein
VARVDRGRGARFWGQGAIAGRWSVALLHQARSTWSIAGVSMSWPGLTLRCVIRIGGGSDPDCAERRRARQNKPSPVSQGMADPLFHPPSAMRKRNGVFQTPFSSFSSYGTTRFRSFSPRFHRVFARLTVVFTLAFSRRFRPPLRKRVGLCFSAPKLRPRLASFLAKQLHCGVFAGDVFSRDQLKLIIRKLGPRTGRAAIYKPLIETFVFPRLQ